MAQRANAEMEAVATEATVGIGKRGDGNGGQSVRERWQWPVGNGKRRWQRRPVGTGGMAMAKTEAVATGQCWEGSKGAGGGRC